MTFNEIKQVKSKSNNVKVTIEKTFTRSNGNNDETFITFKITKPHNTDSDTEEENICHTALYFSNDEEELIRQSAPPPPGNNECPKD